MQHEESDYKRLFVTVLIAALVLFSWQALVEWPRRQQLAQFHQQQMQKKQKEQKLYVEQNAPAVGSADENATLTRDERLKLSPRLPIRSDTLHGSIALKGARFDDLTLAKYSVDLSPNSPDVTLFSPNGEQHAYFAQAGWVASDGKTKVPTQDTVWQADKKQLAAGEGVTLRWNNGEGQIFVLEIALDANYMFTIRQRVENTAPHAISVAPYAFINRAYTAPETENIILHEGPLGVMEGALEEISYDRLLNKGNKVFENAMGWFGITDKYWLSALIPSKGGFKTTFSHYEKNKQHRYQADYLGAPVTIEPGASGEEWLRLFAGAKELDVLDAYATGEAGVTTTAPIPLFDRAVDFGSLYFMTKPMFVVLNFFFDTIGNFGLAIMMLTIVVKLAMYPLANKSYISMAKIRELQPEMLKLRERHGSDQMQLQKEMMALYKREKVNPASGCLPVLIQMPVFFALYKVLYVTIEMRHAPFFAWIKDLSEPDPSNIFTLFGLINWDTPSYLHLGVLPMLMCATMVIQMRQQPAPADPMQAKVIKYMPYVMLVFFATFPAGLVLYWSWSNVLSILQSWYITRKHKSPKEAVWPHDVV